MSDNFMAVIWHATSQRIKEKYLQGNYADFSMKPQEVSNTGPQPTGKHAWNQINTQVYLQHTGNFAEVNEDETVYCGYCGKDTYKSTMGIPVHIYKKNEKYMIEMYAAPPARGYCSFECTYSALIALPASVEFMVVEAKRNLFALFNVMYPGEQELKPRQPLGLPLSEEVLFSPHVLRFTASIPLQILSVGLAYHNK